VTLDRDLEVAFVHVTEQAAIAAGQTMGYGNGKHSDEVAVDAMRRELNRLPMAGRIVIGEGERDEAPMLFVGEELGSQLEGSGFEVDIAVDPLEGTNLCATGAPGAIAVLAAAERGGLLHAPDIYMSKLVVGPTARGKVHLDAPVSENLRNIAKHRELIDDIRTAGARILLIGDGDLSAGIATAVRGTGVHAVMGTGGAPEGVITAAAMRCLGGEIQARLTPLNEKEQERAAALAITDLERIYGTKDLAPGKQILFSSTGVTDGQLLRGVRYFGNGSRTSSLFMSLTRRIVRFVDTIRHEDDGRPIYFQ
jgi:fructose-1,6-bisphosphatase class II